MGDKINVSVTRLLCVCCLSTKRSLIKLDKCKHTLSFAKIIDNKVDFSDIYVCFLCHKFITNIEKFKRQVDKSISTLNERYQELQRQPCNGFQVHLFNHSDIAAHETHNLQMSAIEVNYVINNETIHHEVLEHFTSSIDIKPEIKTEEIFIPQSEDEQGHSDVETSMSSIEELKSEPNDLQISDVEINTFVSDEPKQEVNQHVRINKEMKEKETQEVFISIFQHEHSYSDLDKTTPVKIKEVKKKVKRKPYSHRGLDYMGKIRLITLSQEEMIEERKRESKKTSFINLPFKCEDCVTGFLHKARLDLHKEQRHGPKDGIICTICKSVLCTESSLKEHYRRHVKRYECVECGHRKYDLYAVIKHYNDRHGDIKTTYTCSDCCFTTNSHSKFRYHRSTHRAKSQCKLCGRTFISPTVLRTHMFTVHATADPFVCTICGKKYKSRFNLKAHQAQHTTGPSPDSFCASCKTHFLSPVVLRQHLKTHSKHVKESDKRFTCDECGSKFLTKRLLQEHIDWEHLKKENHVCEHCSKVFKTKTGLKKHKNFVHDKKRPPRNKMCDHCGQGFTTLQILRSHVRTHTGERPLQCKRCPKTFAHSAALYTHNKLVHAKDIQK